MISGLPRKIPLSPRWRRALEILANAAERGGATKSVLLARGFTAEMVASLAHCGLAAMNPDTIEVPGRSIEVVRIRITNAGWYQLMKQDGATARSAAYEGRNDRKVRRMREGIKKIINKTAGTCQNLMHPVAARGSGAPTLHMTPGSDSFRLGAEANAVLKILARTSRGTTDQQFIASFTIELLKLIDIGFVEVQPVTKRQRGRAIATVSVRITSAGRRAIKTN